VSDRPEDEPGWAAPNPPGSVPDATVPSPPAPVGWGEGWNVPSTAPGGTATGAVVPPPQAAAGAPRKPRGRAWLVWLLGALSLIVVMTIGGTVLFVTRTLPPYNGARDFLNDVSHDRTDAADNRLCAADSGSPQAALQVVRQALTGGKTFAVNPLGVDRSGDTATVDFTVTYRSGQSSQTFSLPLTYENGTWKACPSPALR
jgi:hypothetical protein